MTIAPRDYQIAAHDATWRALHERPGRNQLVIMPTGTGKSLQMAMLCWHALSAYPNTRIVALTHVKELIAGNYKELLTLWPSAPAGVYSAGLGQKDHRQAITFAGIMSVASKAALFRNTSIVLVDEAHSISDNDKTAYGRFLTELKMYNKNLVVIGYTATAFRMKQGMLVDGKLFDDVCFDLSAGDAFVWLVDNGYLSTLLPRNPGIQLDSTDIAITNGDYDNKQTSDALRQQHILEQAVDIIIAQGSNRKAWLTFCQSIEDAEFVAEMLTAKGYPHEAVHSKRQDRDEVLAAFKAGKLRGVTNRDILTTGYNQKNIDLISMLRLTRSPGLWVQMLGRGTRPVYAPDFDLNTPQERLAAIAAGPKQNCVVLDFVGNTARLGPINYPQIINPSKRKGGASKDVVRCCEQCATYVHASIKICPCCGFEFPPPERINDAPSDKELISIKQPSLMLPKKEKEIGVYDVHRMLISRHKGKSGKRDTVRVDYYCGTRRFSEWLGFEHSDGEYPRIHALRWWRGHAGKTAAPKKIDDVLAAVEQLKKPKFLQADTSGDYPKILAYDFVGTKFQLPPELGGPPLSEPSPDPLAIVEKERTTWNYNFLPEDFE